MADREAWAINTFTAFIGSSACVLSLCILVFDLASGGAFWAVMTAVYSANVVYAVRNA